MPHKYADFLKKDYQMHNITFSHVSRCFKTSKRKQREQNADTDDIGAISESSFIVVLRKDERAGVKRLRNAQQREYDEDNGR